MTQVIAAEGGYQAFTLSSSEWGWLIFAGAVAIVALLLGVVLMRGVLAKEQGTDKMQEIAGAIQEGALAYLKRQFRTIGMIVIPLAIVVFLTSTAINKPPTLTTLVEGSQVLSFAQSGSFRTLAFIVGC
ncbi:MAG: sodium-translocating pyrophosphatase, partial [Actinobacteria bacterium]|nr:sodium-translocating pyrophosphatase [Actinomycetota bacterium]